MRFSELSNYMRNLQPLLNIDKLIAELEETQGHILHYGYIAALTSFVGSYTHREGIMRHNSLHVTGGRELWLITTLCLYGI